MSSIPGLTENFMGASAGTTVSLSNTVYTALQGSGTSTIIADPFDATKHMDQVVAAANYRYGELSLTPVTTLWFRFDLDIGTPLDVSTPIAKIMDAPGTNTICDIRQVGGGRTLQLRNITTVVWTSTALAASTKHRIYLNVTLSPTKTIRCLVYSGGDNSILSQDSGAITSTTTVTSAGLVRLGCISAATGTLRFGALRGDDSTQPTDAWGVSTSVTIGG